MFYYKKEKKDILDNMSSDLHEYLILVHYFTFFISIICIQSKEIVCFYENSLEQVSADIHIL